MEISLGEAIAMTAQGVRRGDRLAVFSLDSHRYVEIVLAALKLGAVYVPLPVNASGKILKRELRTRD